MKVKNFSIVYVKEIFLTVFYQVVLQAPSDKTIIVWPPPTHPTRDFWLIICAAKYFWRPWFYCHKCCRSSVKTQMLFLIVNHTICCDCLNRIKVLICQIIRTKYVGIYVMGSMVISVFESNTHRIECKSQVKRPLLQ